VLLQQVAGRFQGVFEDQAGQSDQAGAAARERRGVRQGFESGCLGPLQPVVLRQRGGVAGRGDAVEQASDHGVGGLEAAVGVQQSRDAQPLAHPGADPVVEGVGDRGQQDPAVLGGGQEHPGQQPLGAQGPRPAALGAHPVGDQRGDPTTLHTL